MDKVVDSLLTTIKPGNRMSHSSVLNNTTESPEELVSNDTLLALSLVLSQPTVIAALDLVESHAVTRWTSPWANTAVHYTVAGTKQDYLVTLTPHSVPPHDDENNSDSVDHGTVDKDVELSWNQSPTTRSFCSCPAFAYTVLLAAPEGEYSSIMCKHLLAVRIGERLQRVEAKIASEDEHFEHLASCL